MRIGVFFFKKKEKKRKTILFPHFLLLHLPSMRLWCIVLSLSLIFSSNIRASSICCPLYSNEILLFFSFYIVARWEIERKKKKRKRIHWMRWMFDFVPSILLLFFCWAFIIILRRLSLSIYSVFGGNSCDFIINLSLLRLAFLYASLPYSNSRLGIFICSSMYKRMISFENGNIIIIINCYSLLSQFSFMLM